MSASPEKSFGTLDCLNQVAEFHKTFRHPILSEPAIPESNRASLRIRLIQEELDELRDAVELGNITEAADALCDLQYVLSGAILEFGLAGRFPDLFAEVQRSNMSKACASRSEAEETIEWYAGQKGEEAYMEEHAGMFLVYRRQDHKTLKSIRYSPAQLESLLYGSTKE
jgi:predicted HAD superfamily Cof-like phosphohydrolase